MIKYIALVLIIFFATLALMYGVVNSPFVYREPLTLPANPHVYNNPDRSIKNIKVVAFYFVPKNKTASQFADWKNILDDRLKKLTLFHSLELHDASHISYMIYPESIIGLEETAYYDTDITAHGNPQALLHVAEEIDARVFNHSGDLYRKDFSITKQEGYPVLLILYEGVGASGGIIYDSELGSVSEISKKLGLPPAIIYPVQVKTVDSFLLLNRAYLTRVEDSDRGTTILAHEFYHTLGVPDGYQESTESDIPITVSTSDDIMGIGRSRPIDKTYLEKTLLKELGL